MKKNRRLSTWVLFASTGAFICTGSGAFAGDSKDRKAEVQRSYQKEETVIRSDAQLNRQGAQFDAQVIEEPAGAERRTYSSQQTSRMHAQPFGRVHKARDIIGMEVRNQQNEKLGDVKDVMVDLHSGKIPFAVISADGMGDRLIAVPPSALHARADGQQLVLNIDRDRLQMAPSFERNRWPNMANQQWSSDVYRFYGAQPYWQTGSYQGGQQYRSEIYTESTIQDPSGAEWERGAQWSTDRSDRFGRDLEAEGITRLDDISGNRVRGGAVDLQPFASRNEGFRRDSSVVPHEATRGRGTYQQRETYQQRDTLRDPYRGAQQYDRQQLRTGAGISSMGRLHKATELIGANIKNAQNETIGEIKDVVLDINSGNVAYTVVSADRFLDTRNELVAVPPNLFTYGDGRTVTLNANRNVLMNAPRFQRDNWNQVSNEQFVSRVYSHYGQQPYWQAQGFQPGTQYREPAGAEFQQQRQFQQQQSFEQDQFQQPDSSFQQQQDITDPAGTQPQDLELQQQQEAAPSIEDPSGAQPQSDVAPDESSSFPAESQQAPQQLQQQDLEREQPERAISEPSGAQPQSQVVPEEPSSAELESASEPQASAPSAGFQTESSAQIEEPAGAQPDSETVQSQEVEEAAGAASSQDQKVEQQVRSTLKSDSGLKAQNVQATAEDGKIVLRGTVSSETEKQQIEQKVQEAILDNQIRVESSQESDVQSQP